MISSQLRRPMHPDGAFEVETPNGLQGTGMFATELQSPVVYLENPIVVGAPSAANPAPVAAAAPGPGTVDYITNADGTQTPISASDYAQIVASENGVTAASTTSIWSATFLSIPLWAWAIGLGLYFFFERGK